MGERTSASDRKLSNLMTIHVSKSVTSHEVSNNLLDDVGFMFFISHKKGKNTVPFIRAKRNGIFYTYICDEINDIKKDLNILVR